MSETQRSILQWFLLFIIVACVLELSLFFTFYVSDKIRYNRKAKDHFKKIEEYRNELD